MIDLWDIRKKKVHGKEEAAKQQKRKAKAAISVWVLHKLQDQALPSNSFLFYPNTEKTIKNATAAKLEGFVVIKIRLITYSVSKLTK